VQQSKYTPSLVGQQSPASPSQAQYEEHSAPATVNDAATAVSFVRARATGAEVVAKSMIFTILSSD